MQKCINSESYDVLMIINYVISFFLILTVDLLVLKSKCEVQRHDIILFLIVLFANAISQMTMIRWVA